MSIHKQNSTDPDAVKIDQTDKYINKRQSRVEHDLVTTNDHSKDRQSYNFHCQPLYYVRIRFPKMYTHNG